MMQMRTHTCGELRLANAGQRVKIVGWMENVRVVGQNFAFVVLRDFYGTTQVVVENRGDDGHHQRPEQGVHHQRGGHRPGAGQQEPQAGHRRRGGGAGARSRSWAAAATTACPSRSTAAGRPTRPSV